MSRSLPGRVHLPSGRVVRISDGAARRAAAALGEGAPPDGASHEALRGLARDLQILACDGVLADAGGAPLDPMGLALPDAHVLRALLAFAGVVPEAPGSYACENCGAPFDVAPSSLLEIGPFVDGELRDPELDRPFDFSAWHRIPAIRVGRAVCRRVKLVPRTAEEALPLLRLSGDETLRLTPAVVAAMGVAALGPERRASAIADALADAPDAAWAAIVDLYQEARYPARLVAAHRCAGCGARNDLDVPLERELPRLSLPDGTDAGDGSSGARVARRRPRRADAFPDLDAFEALVRAAADRIYRARGVRNIDLFIDAGVAACDAGGEPLLGCYTPGIAADDLGIAQPPEIRIFYRTFQAQHRDDPRFDVGAEISETIDHEVTHHLHHLAGSDPLDDDERAEIEREQVRLVGRAEAGRRARRGAMAELAGFLRATWPVWILVAVGSTLGWCGGCERSSAGSPSFAAKPPATARPRAEARTSF